MADGTMYALGALLILSAFGAAAASSNHIVQLAGELQICNVPNPSSPASAFDITQSTPNANGDYWRRYSCKQACANWRECQVAAYTAGGSALLEAGEARQAVSFVVDGMGGHLAYSTRQSGDKTVLLHTGIGGASYMQGLASQIESASDTKVAMVRWESGFNSWGWYTRTSAPATRVPAVNRRVASLIAWIHENLAGAGGLGTVGCSMGTQATFGAVYWHDVDEAVDYQLMVGGPPLWDINAGCGRRSYSSGYCDVDASRACTSDADCAALSSRSRCAKPGPIPLASLYESVINHVHATSTCSVATAGSTPGTIAAFDESGLGFTAGDWDFDHPIDFQMDIWGPDGDSRWAMADAMLVFNSVRSAAGHPKRWNTTPDANHCAAIGNGRAFALLADGWLNATPSGGNDDGDRPPDEPNEPPEPIGQFDALLLDPGDAADLSVVDRFDDEGALSFSARSSDETVALARIDGNVLRVTGVAPGVATVTVTATDADGLAASSSFDVSVGLVVSIATPVLAVREGERARLRLTLSRAAASALPLSWRIAGDDVAATADADAHDVAATEGAVVVAAGATEAVIDVEIVDDAAIEPAQEFLTVALVPSEAADYAIHAGSAVVEIQEGVCDRTPQLRDALRSGRDCWLPTVSDLAARRFLHLNRRGIVSLQAADLQGLPDLRLLQLKANRLAELPQGLFAGVGALRELDLRDNPGSPFAFALRLDRVDAAAWAPGPAELQASVRPGAPFDVVAQLAATGAELSAPSALVAAGQVAGNRLRVTPTGAGAARLDLAAPISAPTTLCSTNRSDRYPCFQGIAVQAAVPLFLFKPPPMPTAAAPNLALTANGAEARLAFAELFAAGETLSFSADSNAPNLVRPHVVGSHLVLEANADGEEGTAIITLTATDEAGQSATVELTIVVEAAPLGLLRGWRLGWLESTPEGEEQ